MPAQPSSPYATLPRGFSPSPAKSGQASPEPRTPLPRSRGASSSFVASTSAHPQDIAPRPTRASIYAQLTRTLSAARSGGEADGDDALASGWSTARHSGGAFRDSARFHDVAERAQREGNPESWGAMMLAAGVDVDEHLPPRGPPSTGGGSAFTFAAPSGPGTSGFANVQRKASGVLARASSSTSLAKRSLYVDEPGSYAAVEQPILGDADGDGLMDDEELETRRLLGIPQSPSLASNKDAFADDSSDSDSDDESPPARRARPLVTVSWLDKAVARVYPPSPLTKNVVKCVIAYALAELFTFVPVLSDLVGAPFDVEGPVRNAHV